MSWEERHLNWSLVLVWLFGPPASYIAASIIGLAYPDLIEPIGVLISLGLITWKTWWFLKKKNRSIGNLIWIIIPFGIVVLLYLKNLSDKQTLPVANTEKEKHEIQATKLQEKEYKHSVWEIYRRAWATASPEKRTELNKRMLRWQELMKSGQTPSQAYYRVMEEESGKPTPSYSFRAKVSWGMSSEVGKRILMVIALLGVIGLGSYFLDLGSYFLHSTAYDKGYAIGESEGHKAGETTGYSKGRDIGYDEGHDTGYEVGYAERQDTDYSSGKNDGYREGIEAGQKAGYDEGLNAGYNAGYEEGIESSYLHGYNIGYREGVIGARGIDIETGYEAGYNEGYTAGYKKSCGEDILKNPTYSEAIAFLKKDKTNNNTYNRDSYVCVHFAKDVCNNAEVEGFRCAIVVIRSPWSSLGGDHAIVAFETTDKGLVYFEPQFDKQVTVIAGRSFSELNGFQKPLYDDTIADIVVIW